MRKKLTVPPAVPTILTLLIIFTSLLLSRPVSAQSGSASLFYYASRLDCEQARKYLDDILDPKSRYFGLLELGKCYQQNGNFRESLVYLKKAFASNANLDAAPFLLAYSFFRLEDFAQARSWVKISRGKRGPNLQRSELLSHLFDTVISPARSRGNKGESGGGTFTALTDQGKTVTFTNVKAGRIILKPDEEIKISNEPFRLPGTKLTEESTVDLRIGEFFGIGFVVPDIDFGDAVTIEYEFEFPSADPENEPGNINKDTETYDQIFSRSTQYIYSFPPSESPGENPSARKCIQRLYSKGKLLVSHEFQLGK